MTYFEATEIVYKNIIHGRMDPQTDKAVKTLKNVFSEVNVDEEAIIIFGFIFQLSLENNSTFFTLQKIKDVVSSTTYSKIVSIINRQLIVNHILEPEFFELYRFTINAELAENILDEQKNYKFSVPKLSLVQLAVHALDFISQAEGKSTISAVLKYLPTLENFCPDKKIEKLQVMFPCIRDRAILYMLCGYHYNKQNNPEGVDPLIDDIVFALSKNLPEVLELMKSLKNAENILFHKGYIKTRGETILLASNGINFFFPPNDTKIIVKRKPNSTVYASSLFRVILSDSIKPELLYYSSEVREEIELIKKALEDTTFKRLQLALRNNTFISTNTGLSIFLSGGPGVGKTSLVSQLAMCTGRKILSVQISECKSSYVGESEKLIDKIFDEYEAACNDEEPYPILLLNECDALLGKRFSASSESDMMEGAIQGIFLNRLENFGGICICTSNKRLDEDFDEAYQRRFLFNLNIPALNKEDRFYLWKNKYMFNDKCAEQLSEINLSPAEMQNTMKKKILKEVINSKDISFDDFLNICKKEKEISRESIGFVRLCG